MNGPDDRADRGESHDDDAGSAADDGSLPMHRRGAMAVLGAAGLGALATGSAGAQGRGRGNGGRGRGGGNGNQPWYDWEADVDANGNALDNLGAVDVEHVHTAAREADVVVWKGTEGVFHADGHEGEVASGEDVLAVTQAAVDSLTEGRDWKEKVLVASPGTATGEVNRISVPSHTVLDMPFRIHVPWEEGTDYSEEIDYVVHATDVHDVEIPRLRVTGAPFIACRLQGVRRTTVGDFRYFAPAEADSDVGLRIDDWSGEVQSEDVRVGTAYVEHSGNHGVETVNVHRFQADRIIGNDVRGTACLLNTNTDSTINSVIGYEAGRPDDPRAAFRLANGNQNISVGQVVTRGGYRGMAIITDAQRVSVGEVDIADPAINGIQLVDAADVTIGGGVIRNPGDHGVNIYSLNNEPPNENITITDLRIVDDRDEKEMPYAIYESGESRYNRFVDNDLRGGGSEGVINVGSPTTVVRDNTGGGLDEGTATLAGGADPAVRIEGVSSAGSSALEARIQPTEAPSANAAWKPTFVWDADAEAWDLVVEWTVDPGSGNDVEVAYIVDRDQPNLAGVDTGPPSSWNPDEVDEQEGPGPIDTFEDDDLSEYVGSTGNYDVNEDPPVPQGSFSLKNTGGSEALIGSFAGLPRYPAAGDRFAAKAASTDTAQNFGLLFGMQDLSNFYFTRYWKGGPELQIYKVDDGSYNKLAGTDMPQTEQGTVYDYVVDWGTDGTINLELQDGSGNVVASVSAQDAEWSEGGIGTRRAGMLDDVRIL